MAGMTNNLKPHPLAEMIPLMPEDEFAEFKEDIRVNGLKEKIILHEGMILDGRHRARALKELGIPLEGKTREFDEKSRGTPESFVIYKNIRRRHLSKGQRVASVFQILGIREAPTRGRPPQDLHPTDVSVDTGRPFQIKGAKLAQLTGSSPRTIKRVRAVQRKKPELIELIASGEKTLAEAERETGKPPPKRDEAALTIKNIETCVEELHGLLGDLAKATGKDFTSAMVDVNDIMAAITTSRAGRDALIALEWPEVLEGDAQ